MPRVLKLSNNEVVTIFDARDFEYYLEKYMGYEAVQFFRELMGKLDEEKNNLKLIRSDVERQTLELIADINLVDEDDREEIAEEFKAIMEDYFGLEE